MISKLRFSVEIDPIEPSDGNNGGVHFRILARDETSIKKGGEIILRYWLKGHPASKDVPDTSSAMITKTEEGFLLNEICVELMPPTELSTDNENS